MPSLRQLRSRDDSGNFSNFEELSAWIQANGGGFPFGMTTAQPYANGQSQILPDATIESFRNIYRTNGVVFATSAVRQRIFSEVTFRFVSMSNGRNERMFGTTDLTVLEKPWPNGTTGELASRMIHDVDTAGNFYAVRPRGEDGEFTDNRLHWRDPKNMSIVLNGDPLVDEFVDIVGYVYRPTGGTGEPFFYTVDEVAHWMPTPDPDSPFRGMSWITPILREITSDNAATDAKANFFANGMTPNMVVTFPQDVMTQEQFDAFKLKMETAYSGRNSHGKTLYLAPGADVEVVGKNFQEMDFPNTQGRDETRIASAGGVPAVIVGLKESLAGSSLNQGNFSAARRQLADGTMRPLFRSAAAALETVCPAPQDNGAAKLWFDDDNIAFFREDQGDAANIQSTQATTIRTFIDAGFTPKSVIAAVEAEDRTLLVHSGLYSVQLQEPGSRLLPTDVGTDTPVPKAPTITESEDTTGGTP